MPKEGLEEKKAVPIISYLRVPEGDEPYLWGVRCKACGTNSLGPRLACPKCTTVDSLEEVRFGRQGKVWVATSCWQSYPGIPTPYIAAMVQLPEGVTVQGIIEGLDPNDEPTRWFDLPVEMFTKKARTDRDGNDIITYKFRPIKS